MIKKILVLTAMSLLFAVYCAAVLVACTGVVDDYEDDVYESSAWEYYNTIKWSEKYEVPYDPEDAFNGYTTIIDESGNTTWSGYIGFQAQRGSHLYEAENAMWRGDVVYESNGIVSYIDSGDAVYFIFSSDYSGDVLLTLGVATSEIYTETDDNGTPDDPSDDFTVETNPEDADGHAAEDYMAVYSGVLSDGTDSGDMSAVARAATNPVDISDCWIEGTSSWTMSAPNNIGETTLTAGHTNVIAIYSYGQFNLDYLIVTPSNEGKQAYIKEITYDGQTVTRIEAESANGMLRDCRIEYTAGLSGEGNIGYTTDYTGIEFFVTVPEDCTARLVVSAAFGEGSEFLEDRLYFTLNGKFVDLYNYYSEYDISDEEKDRVIIGGDTWYREYNEYVLPTYATLELKAGVNTILVEGGEANFNIDYFELRPVDSYSGDSLVLQAEDGQYGLGYTDEVQGDEGTTVLYGERSVSFVVYAQESATVTLNARYAWIELLSADVSAAQYVELNSVRDYEISFKETYTYQEIELCTLQLEQGLNIITIGIDIELLEESGYDDYESQTLGVLLDYIVLVPSADQ